MHPHWSSILIKASIGVYLLLDEIKNLLRSDTNADFHLFFHYRRHKIVPSFPVQYIFNLFLTTTARKDPSSESKRHIYLACPKTIFIFCAALSTQVKRQARRNRQPTCSAPDHGLGMAGTIYDVGVVRSISFWKCHRAPTVWLPELTQGCRYSLALGRKPPLINRDIFSSIPNGLRRKNQKVFSCVQGHA